MSSTTLESPPQNSSLRAKKKTRDAKRKKLQVLFNQHKRHEQETPSYLKESYQNSIPIAQAVTDVEEGQTLLFLQEEEEEKTSYKTTAEGKSSNNNHLSSNFPNRYGDIMIRNHHQEETLSNSSSRTTTRVLLEAIESNPKQAAMTGFLVMIIFSWWL